MQKAGETYWTPSSHKSLSERSQRDIYYSTIIKPVMLYGSTIWTSCSKENLLKILRPQKRAARIILDAGKNSTFCRLI